MLQTMYFLTSPACSTGCGIDVCDCLLRNIGSCRLKLNIIALLCSHLFGQTLEDTTRYQIPGLLFGPELFILYMCYLLRPVSTNLVLYVNDTVVYTTSADDVLESHRMQKLMYEIFVRISKSNIQRTFWHHRC